MSGRIKTISRLIVVLLVFTFVVHVPTDFSGAQEVDAANRYYYKTVTSKTYTKVVYVEPKSKTKTEKAVKTLLFFMGDSYFGLLDLCNYVYDMDHPGKYVTKYYYTTKYRYDSLGKVKPKVVSKRKHLTLTLYAKHSNNKWYYYNGWKHTVHIIK